MRHAISENKEKEWSTILTQYELKSSHWKTASSNPLILPLDLPDQRYKRTETANLFQRLKTITQPILFINRRIEQRSTLIIKYTGKENYYPLIQELRHRQLVQQKAIIISPNHLSKLKRAKEIRLVKQVAACFSPTFFIKLPIQQLNDYMQFARNEKFPMLMLPFDDLEQYIAAMSSPKHLRLRIDAAFQINHAD